MRSGYNCGKKISACKFHLPCLPIFTLYHYIIFNVIVWMLFVNNLYYNCLWHWYVNKIISFTILRKRTYNDDAWYWIVVLQLMQFLLWRFHLMEHFPFQHQRTDGQTIGWSWVWHYSFFMGPFYFFHW